MYRLVKKEESDRVEEDGRVGIAISAGHGALVPQWVTVNC